MNFKFTSWFYLRLAYKVSVKSKCFPVKIISTVALLKGFDNHIKYHNCILTRPCHLPSENTSDFKSLYDTIPRKFKGGICCGSHLAVTYRGELLYLQICSYLSPPSSARITNFEGHSFQGHCTRAPEVTTYCRMP